MAKTKTKNPSRTRLQVDLIKIIAGDHVTVGLLQKAYDLLKDYKTQIGKE